MTTCIFQLILLVFVYSIATAISYSTSRVSRIPSLTALKAKIKIERDEESVGLALCKILEEEYVSSISSKGTFCFSISGGSMLKMLSNLNTENTVIDWKNCVMGFVSHRCVPLEDEGSTYHKARPAFLNTWIDKGLKVISVKGTTDSQYEASEYEKSLKDLGESILPYSNGLPVFDVLLIGIGMDGHVGSIYPNLSDDITSKRVIVPATSKNGKISMSLPAMLNSKVAVVACAGKSSKAPLGKAEAMKRGLEGSSETAMTFPASILREKAIWLLDEASAVLLTR